MNKIIPFFSINGVNIHKINQFAKQKDYAIKIGNETFQYCGE
jgi:hypothetical protein